MSSRMPVVGSYQRNFGHCIVSWKIKNYFLAACKPGTEIKSERFLVHSWQDTRWQVIFRVKQGNEFCQVLLRRLSDGADKSIKVSWRVTMFHGDGRTDFITDDVFTFKQNSQRPANVPDPCEIDQVLDSDLGEVRIEIQMIVFMSAEMIIPKLSDIHVQSLVENLKFAARRKLHNDLTIHLNVEAIAAAHRAMLLTRSKTLEQAEGDANTRTYFIHEDEIEAFDSLNYYLYTSDLSYIFKSPSVSIYRLIANLDIKELIDAYPQEKVTMETIIEATEFVYQWKIPKFIYNEMCPNCSVYESNGSNSNGMGWHLRIFPTEVAGDPEPHVKYIYLEASIVNNVEPQDVVICIRARRNKEEPTVVKRKYGTIEYMKLGTKFVRIDNPSVANSLSSLDISLSVHTATGTTTSIVTATCPPVDFKLTNSAAFHILQRNLKYLLEKSLYSDITLSVEGHEFKCHKFLLAARSRAFRGIFMARPGASLEFRNVSRDVLGVFLHYLYTGVLPDTEPGVTSDLSVIFLMHLCLLSINFEVQRLTTLCLNRLTNELSQQNACCTLVFAGEGNLAQLQSRALEFFSLHPDSVIHNQCWSRLEKKNPGFLGYVASLLEPNSCRAEFDLDAKLYVPDLLGLNDMIKYERDSYIV